MVVRRLPFDLYDLRDIGGEGCRNPGNLAALELTTECLWIELSIERRDELCDAHKLGLKIENSADLRRGLLFIERLEGFEESGIVDWREAFLLRVRRLLLKLTHF